MKRILIKKYIKIRVNENLIRFTLFDKYRTIIMIDDYFLWITGIKKLFFFMLVIHRMKICFSFKQRLGFFIY